MLFLTKNGYCLLMSTLVVKTALRGYHVYQAVWEPHVGEAFIALQESSNAHGILSHEENDLHLLSKAVCSINTSWLALFFCAALLC